MNMIKSLSVFIFGLYFRENGFTDPAGHPVTDTAVSENQAAALEPGPFSKKSIICIYVHLVVLRNCNRLWLPR